MCLSPRGHRKEEKASVSFITFRKYFPYGQRLGQRQHYLGQIGPPCTLPEVTSKCCRKGVRTLTSISQSSVPLAQIRFLNKMWAQRLCCFSTGFNSHRPLQCGQLFFQIVRVYGCHGQDYYPRQIRRKTAGVLKGNFVPSVSP